MRCRRGCGWRSRVRRQMRRLGRNREEVDSIIARMEREAHRREDPEAVIARAETFEEVSKGVM